jgi:hypothetical protein
MKLTTALVTTVLPIVAFFLAWEILPDSAPRAKGLILAGWWATAMFVHPWERAKVRP